MRDWLTFIIVLLIVVILIDGVRRMRLARRDRIRMSPHIYKTSGREDSSANDFYTSELPNGGARVVGQRDPSHRAPNKTPAKARSTEREQHKPEQTRLNLDAAVPMLMESVTDNDGSETNPTSAKANSLTTNLEGVAAKTLAAARDFASRTYQNGSDGLRSSDRIEPSLGTESSAADDGDYEHDYDRPHYPEQKAALNTYDEDEGDYEEDSTADYHSQSVEDDYEDDAYYDEDTETQEDYHSITDDEADDEDYQEDDYQMREAVASTAAVKTNQSERPAAEPEEVLIINVMASKGGSFKGDELLDVLLRCGMRFGDMDIFHRYSDSKGEGALLFSLANIVKPGTFDLDAMDQFETPGVSLFMTLPIKADSLQSFELMVDTARCIADSLNGELKDEQRSVMTRQTIDHCRERIRDFERRRLFSRQR